MSERKEHCATCRWWWAANEVERDYGECHARAPLPVLAVEPSCDWFDTETWWPYTYLTQGCGEWKPKDETP